MLESRRAVLAARIREGVRAVRAASASGSRSLDLDDSTLRESADDIEMALMHAASETLRMLDAALARLAKGRYGDCVECAEPIAAARLEALPFAIRCLDCATTHEQSLARRTTESPRSRLTQFPSALDHG